jgi:phosphopantothenate---cysteine ligase (CTP)
MHWLVTAGGTSVPIDKVRSITNSSTGLTGASIAVAAYNSGHHVTLLTSETGTISNMTSASPPSGERWAVRSFRTFDDLHDQMKDLIVSGRFDALVHSAAVSDYLASRIYAPSPGTAFDSASAEWHGKGRPRLVDRVAGKIASNEPELWLRMVKAPKLVDLVRIEWRFQGVLVKFKLEVGVSDAELLSIAERSRVASDADLMIANTLEGSKDWAWIGPAADKSGYDRLTRSELPERVVRAVEQCHERRRHG